MNSSLDAKLAQLKQAQEDAATSSCLEHLETKVWQRIEAKKAPQPLRFTWMPPAAFFQVAVKPAILASIMGFGLGIITPAILLLPTSPDLAQTMLHFEIFKPHHTPIHFLVGSKSL
jgi:hypothetical protein